MAKFAKFQGSSASGDGGGFIKVREHFEDEAIYLEVLNVKDITTKRGGTTPNLIVNAVFFPGGDEEPYEVDDAVLGGTAIVSDLSPYAGEDPVVVKFAQRETKNGNTVFVVEEVDELVLEKVGEWIDARDEALAKDVENAPF